MPSDAHRAHDGVAALEDREEGGHGAEDDEGLIGWAATIRALALAHALLTWARSNSVTSPSRLLGSGRAAT